MDLAVLFIASVNCSIETNPTNKQTKIIVDVGEKESHRSSHHRPSVDLSGLSKQTPTVISVLFFYQSDHYDVFWFPLNKHTKHTLLAHASICLRLQLIAIFPFGVSLELMDGWF